MPPPPAPIVSAAECVEQIDTHLYRLQHPPPAAGSPTRVTAAPPAAPDFSAGVAPAVEWNAPPPGGDYHPPSQVARRLFAWLSPSAGVPPVEPEQAVALLAGAHPSEGEVLALVGLAAVAGSLDPATLSGRAERVRRAFGVSEAFVTQVVSAVQSLPGRPPLPARFFADTPKPVFDKVAEAITHAARPRRPLDGLQAGTYQHPADHAAQLRLTAIPGNRLAGWLASYSGQVNRRMLEGRGFEVLEHTVPLVYRAYRAAAEVLGVAPLPRLFLNNQGFTPGVSGLVSAETFGTDEPCIQISMGAASALDAGELTFLLARELGHIQAGHVGHRGLVQWLLRGANVLASMTLNMAAPVVDFTLRPFLTAYYRATALTADRAGLLAAGREAALRVLLKQTGFPIRDAAGLRTRWLIEQAVRRRADAGGRSAVTRILEEYGQLGLEEPLITDRAEALLEWVADGGYAEVLDATPAQRRLMAARRQDDPQLQLLTEMTVRHLTDWAAERLSVSPATTGPAVRRMVYEQVPPTGRLAAVKRVELVVHGRGANRFEYELVVLLLDGVKVFEARIPLPFPAPRDDAPAVVRGDFLRHGGPTLVRKLFPVSPS